MKNLKLRTTAVLLVAVILLGAQTNIFAQQRKGMGNGYGQGNGNICNNIPGITEEQKGEIQKLKVIQMKSRQTTQNQIRENRAHLITLQSADKADMDAINKTIDEITSLQNKQWKKRAAHKQDVRNTLTDDQRVYFDVNSGRKGNGYKHGNCNNKNRGNGNGHGGGSGNGQGYNSSN